MLSIPNVGDCVDLVQEDQVELQTVTDPIFLDSSEVESETLTVAELSEAEDTGNVSPELEPGQEAEPEPEEAAEPEEEEDPTRPLISSFDIDDASVALLADKGITKFTPIQAQSYDPIIAVRHKWTLHRVLYHQATPA